MMAMMMSTTIYLFDVCLVALFVCSCAAQFAPGRLIIFWAKSGGVGGKNASLLAANTPAQIYSEIPTAISRLENCCAR
jgi:hypothetical protein